MAKALATGKALIHKTINRTVVNKDSIEAFTPEKEKNVEGTFVNIETPGQPAKISAKLYRGQEYFSKTFEDGERCVIPLSIARFINERINHEKHSYLLDEKGNPMKDGKRHSRYKFMIETIGV